MTMPGSNLALSYTPPVELVDAYLLRLSRWLDYLVSIGQIQQPEANAQGEYAKNLVLDANGKIKPLPSYADFYKLPWRQESEDFAARAYEAKQKAMVDLGKQGADLAKQRIETRKVITGRAEQLGIPVPIDLEQKIEETQTDADFTLIESAWGDYAKKYAQDTLNNQVFQGTRTAARDEYLAGVERFNASAKQAFREQQSAGMAAGLEKQPISPVSPAEDVVRGWQVGQGGSAAEKAFIESRLGEAVGSITNEARGAWWQALNTPSYQGTAVEQARATQERTAGAYGDYLSSGKVAFDAAGNFRAPDLSDTLAQQQAAAAVAYVNAANTIASSVSGGGSKSIYEGAAPERQEDPLLAALKSYPFAAEYTKYRAGQRRPNYSGRWIGA